MIGMMIFAAAAGHAPVLLASRDETQWRMFVRASLQRPAAARGSRLRQLQGVVRGLGDDRRRSEALSGPAGL